VAAHASGKQGCDGGARLTFTSPFITKCDEDPGSRGHVWAEAGRITQPVLAVLGADSHTLWPGWVEGHHLVQAWWPQAEAFVLKGATHGLQLIDPQGMAEGLAGFFARHPLPARL
jgi:pimeloyl-ACP methyl ester carboxylesterase